jgi:hypothetical protein
MATSMLSNRCSAQSISSTRQSGSHCRGINHRRAISYFVGALIIFSAFSAPARAQANPEVSGDYYNWQKTLQPEKPWLRYYSQTLVMKIFLCSRDSTGKVARVYLTFDQALDVIRRLDNLTLGIPKIIYLVGWQFTGNDSGYPSWSVVNARLKRPQDKTALESLKWLIVQAQQYHTTVSLHINMIDAYPDSPLWSAYDKNNIILKDVSGTPIKGEVFDGVQSYQISYAQEWKLGFAQKRIDDLLRMLPELRQGATIHIDAFHSIQPTRPKDPLSSPYLHLTIDDEVTAQRKIFRYWRANGMDVTTEYAMGSLRKDPFIGLQPMAWWFSLDQFEKYNWVNKPADFKALPPTLYVGTPMHAEEEIKKDSEHLTGLSTEFCTNVVPWYFANNPQSNKEDLRTDGGNILAPALWRSYTLVGCSPTGYASKTWRLPASWKGTSRVRLTHVTMDGLQRPEVLPVTNGSITLTLKANEVVAVQKNF